MVMRFSAEVNNVMSSKVMLHKKFQTQAAHYVGAFLISWFFPTIFQLVIVIRGVYPWPLLFLTAVSVPIQGVLNLITFTRPKFIKYRKTHHGYVSKNILLCCFLFVGVVRTGRHSFVSGCFRLVLYAAIGVGISMRRQKRTAKRFNSSTSTNGTLGLGVIQNNTTYKIPLPYQLAFAVILVGLFARTLLCLHPIKTLSNLEAMILAIAFEQEHINSQNDYVNLCYKKWFHHLLSEIMKRQHKHRRIYVKCIICDLCKWLTRVLIDTDFCLSYTKCVFVIFVCSVMSFGYAPISNSSSVVYSIILTM